MPVGMAHAGPPIIHLAEGEADIFQAPTMGWHSSLNFTTLPDRHSYSH